MKKQIVQKQHRETKIQINNKKIMKLNVLSFTLALLSARCLRNDFLLNKNQHSNYVAKVREQDRFIII